MFSGVKSISPDKLQKYVKDGSKVTIVDIRPVEEYTHSRIPGSIHYDTAATQKISTVVVLVCLNGLHSIERCSTIQKFVLFSSFSLSSLSFFSFFPFLSFSFLFFFFKITNNDNTTKKKKKKKQKKKKKEKKEF